MVQTADAQNPPHTVSRFDRTKQSDNTKMAQRVCHKALLHACLLSQLGTSCTRKHHQPSNKTVLCILQNCSSAMSPIRCDSMAACHNNHVAIEFLISQQGLMAIPLRTSPPAYNFQKARSRCGPTHSVFPGMDWLHPAQDAGKSAVCIRPAVLASIPVERAAHRPFRLLATPACSAHSSRAEATRTNSCLDSFRLEEAAAA